MATQWLRRSWLLAACASALLLAACGGGNIDSQFAPTRVLAFGDATGDVGQTGARYTVNDGSINIWTHFVANAFGRPLTAQSAGGLGFATGNARVVAEPDAGGSTATMTVQEQLDAFLNAGGAFDANDLVLVSAGTSDVIVQAKAAMDATITADQALVNTDQAARDLAVQIRRMVAAGARHVVVAGVRNLAGAPWAFETGQGPLLEMLSSVSTRTGESEPRAFNDRLKIEIADLGANVLYVETASYFMLVAASPASNNLDNATGYACTSVDSGAGIGTGANQVNSRNCTTGTLQAGIDYNRWLYADRVYLTPRGNQLLGDLVVARMRERW
jgi:phospholipase/lecithinase/hemolysin